MKKISYRKCKRKDLIPAAKLLGTSMNNLRRQTGKKPLPWRVKKIPPWIEHLLSTDPDTFYCAWSGNKIIGFSCSVNRGKQWYLAYLFVHPRFQDKGVGRKLLEKVWRDGRDMSHALCTFSYNTQAIGIYSKFGMAPLCDLPMMQLDPLKMKKIEPTGLKIADTFTRADLAWINKLEYKIRGYSHPSEWKYWIQNDKFKLYIFRYRGKRVGYSLINDNIQIAPAGAINNDYLTKVMAESLRIIKPEKDNKILIWCPTLNIKLYCSLIDIGFRITELEIFMSDQPYPDWQRYLPANLSVI